MENELLHRRGKLQLIFFDGDQIDRGNRGEFCPPVQRFIEHRNVLTCPRIMLHVIYGKARREGQGQIDIQYFDV